MMPAIIRVLRLLLPLKSCYQSQDRCPLLLLNIYGTPLSEAWLYSVHRQASSFIEAVKKAEGQTVTAIEIIDSINGLKTTLMFRLENCFLPSTVRTILAELETGRTTSRRGTEVS
jgi:hypothetical protein